MWRTEHINRETQHIELAVEAGVREQRLVMEYHCVKERCLPVLNTYRVTLSFLPGKMQRLAQKKSLRPRFDC